ncbi:sensor histidine kinase [Gordonia otitidis]|uniref:Two-component histidine kinase n=1 Tax=Gordonia otitidis (strain DSM 44809 / CCUG 52243 / JCM 12355 / NBRC 100426 / IFM 10032) TaxID=1108044 RepID=H5TKI5_GORO1|nr:ATP-binding protein [Gordonia otitidis]GAB33993.1 putative two-component histidine kinase [Gordonia otitidis NBRC 100426]
MATDSAAPSTVSATAPTLRPDDASRDALAGRRILRQFTLFASAGYLLYCLLAVGPITAATKVVSPWWTVLAVVLTFGTGVAMGPLTWRADSRRLQIITGVNAVGYLIAVGLWWFAWNGGHIYTVQGFWMAAFPGLAAITAALAFRPMWAYAVLVVAVTSSVLIDRTVRRAEVVEPFAAQTVWAIAFSMVFVVAAIMGRRTARVLDDSRAEAYATTAAAAAARARSAERHRFDALTHDSVMSTLLLAARRGTSPELVQDARNALSAIDRAGTDVIDDELGATDALSRIRAAIALVAPQQIVTVDHVDPSARYPGAVVTAIAGASAEAVRNAVRHAGRYADISVHVSTSTDTLHVDIADTGAGFDPTSVPASRLGISVSIVGRMSKLAGGSAIIESHRGSGTTVRLSWTHS